MDAVTVEKAMNFPSSPNKMDMEFENNAETLKQEEMNLISEKKNENIHFDLTETEQFWEADLLTLFIYKCDICQEHFTGEKDLWRHRQELHSHYIMNGFITEVYKYIVKETRLFINYRCQLCGEKLLGNDRLWHHRKKRHADVAVYCGKCEFVGIEEDGLFDHNKEEHLVEENEASTITDDAMEDNPTTDNQNISTLNTGRRDFSRKSAGILHSCTKCDFNGTINKLKRHLRQTHQETSEHSCSICGFTAKRKQVIQNHMKVEHEGVRFQCDTCSFQAKSSLALKTHKNTRHGIGESFPCELCGYIAPNRGRLNFHIKTVHEGASFPCPECDFTTRLKGSLKNHMASQHGEKVFLCDMCDYRAALKENLRTHIEAKHRGIKYPCKLCNFEASYTNDLRKHVRTVHEGIKYHCSMCDFSATRRFAVTRHTLRVHGKVEPKEGAAEIVTIVEGYATAAGNETSHNLIYDGTNVYFAK